MTFQPFTIDVPQAVLDHLNERLARTRWPDKPTDAGCDYGTNLGFMRDLVAYWRDGYDWRAQEATLNGFAQFRAEVDGVGIHFIHERGEGQHWTGIPRGSHFAALEEPELLARDIRAFFTTLRPA